MSQPIYTPETWRIDQEFYEDRIQILDVQDVTICTIWKQPLDPAEWAAGNACLIKAAPSIFEALDNIVGSGAQHEHTCDKAEHDEQSGCIYCEARSVLAGAFDWQCEKAARDAT
jgi:hypothetical protein